MEKLNTDYGYDLVRYMNPEEVREMFHSSYFDGGGSLDMGGAHLHPLNYALGLAQAAEDSGVKIYENSRVTSYSNGSPCIVKTNQGEVKADHVVLACNGYLDNLENKLAVKIMPINNFILATEQMSEEEVRYINRDDVCVPVSYTHLTLPTTPSV